MRLFNRALLFVCTTFTLSACSFVTLEPKAENVFVAPNDQALASCTDMGKTSVSVWSRAQDIQSREQVEDQLHTLARNSAVKMGANAVAPISDINQGQQMFRMYNCSGQSRMNTSNDMIDPNTNMDPIVKQYPQPVSSTQW